MDKLITVNRCALAV